MNKIKWYKNKILGDFAEIICTNHFEALGYHVESTGIEKSAKVFTQLSNLSSSKSISSDTIYKKIHQTPDLLISRLFNNKLESFFIEVKYRNHVDDYILLENQLLWKYRREIWSDQILDVLNFNAEEKSIWLNCNNSLNQVLLNKITTYNKKQNYINLSIIFYLVVKNPPQNENHIYCNFATFPKWWNIGNKSFDSTSFNTYISNNSLNNYINFNEIYYEEIKPALEDIFS